MKSWSLFVKTMIYLAIGLGIFGMLGVAYFIIRDSGKRPMPPNLLTDSLLENWDPDWGYSVIVTRNKTQIYDRTHPVGDGLQSPVYPMGQLQDLLIAAGVMVMVDREQLAFESRLGALLPDLPEHLQEVEVFQLLTHTSGIGPQGSSITPPGSASFYAPENYRLLGKVLESLSGKQLPAFLQEVVLDPLKDVRIEDSDWSLKHTFYREAGSDPGGLPPGWYTSPQDMRHWEQLMNTNKLIRLKTFLKSTKAPVFDDGTRGGFGFAWSIRNHKGLRMEQIASSSEQGGASITRFPEKNFAVVVFTDQPGSNVDPGQLGLNVAECYLLREMPFPQQPQDLE